MDLSIEVIDQIDKSTVELNGEIDVYTAPKLRDALIPLTKTPNYMLEVDLKNVNYMDSTGLGVFISVLKSTKENESHFKLINLQERVLRLFTITGLDEIININATIQGTEQP